MKKDRELTINENTAGDYWSAGEIFKEQLSNKDREIFAVLCLDTKGKPVCYSEVHVGTLNQSLIHPREIFKVAILSNAHSIIVAHNHPSGNTTPSQQDISITDKLVKASRVLNIPLLDHLIISDTEMMSLRNKQPNLFDE